MIVVQINTNIFLASGQIMLVVADFFWGGGGFPSFLGAVESDIYFARKWKEKEKSL